MIRTLNIMALTIAFVLAGALYVAKNDVKHAQIRLDNLHVQIAATRQEIHLLENEEAYLERPERLAALAKTHLGTIPLRSTDQAPAKKILVQLRTEANKRTKIAALAEDTP